MTAIALPRLAPRSLIGELLDRQPTLARFGLLLLALACVTGLAQLADARTLAGVNVWVKPTKFFVSVGVFALTAAWFFGYVRLERRSAPLLRGTVTVLIVAGTLELAYISWAAANGVASHFNHTSTFFDVAYALMGVLALLLIGTTLPLAWEIGRRPAPGLSRDFTAAVVIGLVLTFLLGGGLGGYMSAQAGHSVGAQGGSVALFGWNRSGGDLRVAHFMGIHAEQAIPLLAALAGLTRLSQRARWHVLVGGTALYVLVTVGVFAQAVAGAPLLPL